MALEQELLKEMVSWLLFDCKSKAAIYEQHGLQH